MGKSKRNFQHEDNSRIEKKHDWDEEGHAETERKSFVLRKT